LEELNVVDAILSILLVFPLFLLNGPLPDILLFTFGIKEISLDLFLFKPKKD
jgi:hypothetical protein